MVQHHLIRILSSWDVSSVTQMDYMFNGAASFNQNISGWCVPNISSDPTSFSSGSSLSNENKPVWEPVTRKLH